MGEVVENINAAPVSEDELYGFKRQEMYSGTLAGSVAPYGRHVFLCHGSHETWLPRVESEGLPQRFAKSFKDRRADFAVETKLTVCGGGGESDGDVLVFPDMIRYKALKDTDVDAFVEDVLVNGKQWTSGIHEELSGSFVFVCAHGSRDKRCGVCEDCGGAEYAKSNGIPVLVFPKPQRESSDGLSPTELVHVLREYGVDFVLLAGYLKLIPVELVKAFPKRILNIHPALLPAFGGKGLYGMRVHKAVLASGARYSGPTIHFVDEEYDTGRILAQSAVRVIANDTPEDLAKRVLDEEHKLYVEVVAAICEERIKWREDGVPLIQRKDNPDEYY